MVLLQEMMDPALAEEAIPTGIKVMTFMVILLNIIVISIMGDQYNNRLQKLKKYQRLFQLNKLSESRFEYLEKAQSRRIFEIKQTACFVLSILAVVNFLASSLFLELTTTTLLILSLSTFGAFLCMFVVFWLKGAGTIDMDRVSPGGIGGV